MPNELSALEMGDRDAAAVQKTPNRVSLAQIEQKIVGEYSFTLDKAIGSEPIPAGFRPDVFTLCVLVLENGWVVVGDSSPADPDNFDPNLGTKFAREKAVRQIWPLEGYLLREVLSK